MEDDLDGEGSIDYPTRGGHSSELSSVPPAVPDWLSAEGIRNPGPHLVASSASPSSSGGGTGMRQTRGSLLDSSARMSQRSALAKEEKKVDSMVSVIDHVEDATAGERSFNFRSWLSADLQQEAVDETPMRRKTRASSVGPGQEEKPASRPEKFRQKREGHSKERNVRSTEAKSLMEQVAFIAAQSRGIMRAQPKQSEQQKLMNEIIFHMGKMAEKVSRLMLIAEPNDEDDEYRSHKSGASSMSPEVAEDKAEQILALLATGETSDELEWKRLEIQSILMAETDHPRKRTNDKRKALEGLALRNNGRSSSTSRLRPDRDTSSTADQPESSADRWSNRSRLHHSYSSKSTGSRDQRHPSAQRSSSLGNVNTVADRDKSSYETRRHSKR